VIGASGGIGAAVCAALAGDARCGGVARLARREDPAFDITDEATVAARAQAFADEGAQFSLIFDATGALEIDGHRPEKALRQLDPAVLARAFAVNAIGPALLLKHFSPLMPRQGKCVFASLSARVGSIGDNRLGGWYGYRSAKAALNQILHTAAIEIARKRPEAVCVALHPGTVDTPLTAPYSAGRATVSPGTAADRLLVVLDGLEAAQTGGFFAYDGAPLPW